MLIDGSVYVVLLAQNCIVILEFAGIGILPLYVPAIVYVFPILLTLMNWLDSIFSKLSAVNLKNMLKELKSEYSPLAAEHEKSLTKKTAAHKYTKQVRQYLLQKQADKQNEQSRQRTQSQKRNKYTLE